jgi:sodium transport system permease protein
MRTLLTVFAKEFLENLRDRRTLLSALLFGPLFGPLLFGLMVSRMLEQSVVETDVPLKITISGGHYAPGLIRYLEGRGVKLTHKELSENEARAAVRNGGSQVVLLVPADYPKAFVEARPAPILLFADSSDSQTRKIADRAKAMLGTYGSTIAQLRLEMRGVSPLLSIPIAVN